MTETTPQAHRVPQYRMPEAHANVEKVNRRLAKLGLGPFQIKVTGTEVVTGTDPMGRRFDRTMVNFDLVRPEINKIAGWTFVARLDVLADGNLVTAVLPGQELGGYRPQTQTCDHCGIDRYRKATYLLRHQNGEIKQVGSTCLAAFLGVEVRGLWALEWDLEINERDDDGLGGFGHGWIRTETPLRIVQLALALTQDGKGYVTRAAAEINGGQTTAGKIQDILNPTPKDLRDPPAWQVEAREAIKTVANRKLAEEVLQFAKDLEGVTDYATNLRALAAQEVVEVRHVGMVASAVAAWYRANHERVERQTAQKVNEWVGTEGDKVEGIEVTVTGVRFLEGQYGTTTLLTFKDAEGHAYKWFATGEHNYDEGEGVVIVRATIKAHDEYQGRKQTVLTRAKLQEA